jgi:hypothetical protein
MNETTIDPVVHEMMLAIERGDLWWPLPMIRALEMQSRGAALEWCVAFLESQLSHFASPDNRTVREDWLTAIRELKTTNVTTAELGRQAREIWYYRGERDKWQTAASNFYGAFAAFKAGRDVGYYRALAMVIAVLAAEESNAADVRCIETLVHLFHAFRER